MKLFFTIATPRGGIFRHTLRSHDLAMLLDIVTQFTRSGAKVVAANLEDEQGQRLSLPVEAFDDEPMGDYLRELEKDYQHLIRP